MTIIAHRYHDISYGHRVYQHESKCANLHGHNARVHFHIEARNLDQVGRVVDFSVIKTTLCEWLEQNWDHRFLLYQKDPWVKTLRDLDPTVVVVDFNPTAENLANHLLRNVGPHTLPDTVRLIKVTFEETRKCGVTVT